MELLVPINRHHDEDRNHWLNNLKITWKGRGNNHCSHTLRLSATSYILCLSTPFPPLFTTETYWVLSSVSSYHPIDQRRLYTLAVVSAARSGGDQGEKQVIHYDGRQMDDKNSWSCWRTTKTHGAIGSSSSARRRRTRRSLPASSLCDMHPHVFHPQGMPLQGSWHNPWWVITIHYPLVRLIVWRLLWRCEQHHAMST